MRDEPKRAVGANIFLKPRQVEIEARLGKRVDIRENDGVTAEILHGGTFVPVRVWDLTTSGACVVTRESLNFKMGDSVQMRICFLTGQMVTSDYRICWVKDRASGQKVGLKMLADQGGERPLPEAQDNMLRLTSSYPISGYIYNHVNYQERSIFRLVAISAGKIILDVLDREHLFFPQQTIELHFSLQTSSSETLFGKIARVLQVKRDSVRLLIEVPGEVLSKRLERDIINHLILDPGLNMEKIRNAGFKIRNIASGFRFRFVRTQEEYEQVLKLRFAAYEAAGKLPEGATLHTVIAPLDRISRILIALHGDNVVASVAMSFPETEDVILDTEKPLKGGYQGKVPQKTEMIEIARLCTAPEYRGGDLLLRMFEHIYRIFATSGRRYLISSTDKKLWPIYKNLGFKKVGLSYPHPYLAGMIHEVILIDLTVPVTGASIGLLRWHYLYSKMTEFMQRRQPLKRTGVGRLRYLTFLGASKVIGIIERLRS